MIEYHPPESVPERAGPGAASRPFGIGALFFFNVQNG